MRITVAQINPTVGAVEDNVDRVLNVLEKASTDGANLAVFPELVITGYPPKDLLERPAFIEQARRGLERIVVATGSHAGMGVVVGCPIINTDRDGKALYNSAFLIAEGRVVFQQAKILLPTYDVFDEARYFKPATDNAVYEFGGVKLGLSICEDLWFEPDPWNKRPYPVDPIDMLAKKGATFFVNISASPFSAGKEKIRFDLIRNHAVRHGVPFLFVNQVGGNDDLVFDGRSIFVNAGGHPNCVFPSFEEAVRTIDTGSAGPSGPYPVEDELDTILRALVLGTRDYLAKCGIRKVIIGLSGGIDSAVTAVIAHRAVGADNMVLMSMPSPHTSRASVEDAARLASNLGVRLETIPIHEVMKAYDAALQDAFERTAPDVTEENLQARIRGNYLMAYSNKFGHLPLSTGNKSELAVGYCTLYGDMSGGLSVISDVPKTMVYELAEFINTDGEIIPKRIIERVPSAELRPGQVDQDVLPPYPILDAILERYIERQMSRDDIVKDGFEGATVEWVISTVRRNEYKRKQAAPGIKVTSKAFGTGRRMPIAARYDA